MCAGGRIFDACLCCREGRDRQQPVAETTQLLFWSTDCILFKRIVINRRNFRKLDKFFIYCLLGHCWDIFPQKKEPTLVSSCKLLKFKVPRTGIEPAHCCQYQILSLTRLPVPPSGHLCRGARQASRDGFHWVGALRPLLGTLKGARPVKTGGNITDLTGVVQMAAKKFYLRG